LNYLRLGAIAAVRGKYLKMFDTKEAYRRDVLWAREGDRIIMNAYWYSREEVGQIRREYAGGVLDRNGE
jgi:hypothetical protein